MKLFIEIHCWNCFLNPARFGKMAKGKKFEGINEQVNADTRSTSSTEAKMKGTLKNDELSRFALI